MTQKVEALFDSLTKSSAIQRAELSGCTKDDVLKIERHFGCRLPVEYQRFLEIAGKSAGKLFRGTAIFYPEVLNLQSHALSLFAELGLPSVLPVDAKVFCMHQGYEVNYFLPGVDNPPVFQFVEGQVAVTQPWPTFSDFIGDAVESHLKIWPRLEDS